MQFDMKKEIDKILSYYIFEDVRSVKRPGRLEMLTELAYEIVEKLRACGLTYREATALTAAVNQLLEFCSVGEIPSK